MTTPYRGIERLPRFCGGSTVSKATSQRKWKRIQEGTLEPDKLYFLDEAPKIAGLM